MLRIHVSVIPMPPFLFCLIPIKKAGKRNCLFTRRCSWLYFALLYQVPGFLLVDFNRPQIYVYFYLVLAFEILWHSPRVPADAASAILEIARGKYISCFIYNLKFRCFESTAVLYYSWIVTFAGLSGY